MDTRGDVTSSVLEDHRNKAMNIFTNEYGLSLVRRLFMVGFFFLNSHEMRDSNADFLSFFFDCAITSSPTTLQTPENPSNLGALF